MSAEETTQRTGAFPCTRWTLIASAAGEGQGARRALEDLCRQYWPPVYFFARRRGLNHADAEDTTQAFFAELLERGSIHSASPDKGRMRTFLLTALKRFMINQHEKATAAKRGSGVPPLSLDFGWVEGRFLAEPSHSLTPDIEFDRQWALRILDLAFELTKREAEARGRTELFNELQGLISMDAPAAPYAEIAERHGLTEAGVKSAAHRMRGQFRTALRSVIAETVAEESAIDEEIAHLFSVFRAA